MGDQRLELTASDLEAAARRVPDAVVRIYRAYSGALFCFFLAATGDKQAAEDLTGTAFASAIDQLGSFTGQPGMFSLWLFEIARRGLDRFWGGPERDGHRLAAQPGPQDA